MDARAVFEGKKITVLGLGLLGRGVGDAKYLAEQGAELIITDIKSAEELAPSLAQLEKFPSITYRLGEHKEEDFKGRDYILKAAGVPDPSPYLEVARAEGTPIKMSASWFAEISGVQCVGITGTRGKSTATYMIHGILEKAGIPTVLGGNIRGVSTLALHPFPIDFGRPIICDILRPHGKLLAHQRNKILFPYLHPSQTDFQFIEIILQLLQSPLAFARLPLFHEKCFRLRL
jgi:hypothetical protein